MWGKLGIYYDIIKHGDRVRQFFERLYYHPQGVDYLIILLLSPLSLLYGSYMFLRRISARKKGFGIPIVSIGNLVVGGSGKTPFVIALASRYENVAIVSRGYGRESKGLFEVSRNGNILVDVKQSGDEPMLMALSLSNASVIVGEKREEAIALAKANGAEIIILDDGFNRVNVEKYDILLKPASIPNSLPFPAGPLREFSFSERFADKVVQERREYRRIVQVDPFEGKLLLATAIANPARLEPYIPNNVVGRFYLHDHAYFDEFRLAEKMKEVGADALLVTQKDAVKMDTFKLPVVQMKLKLEIEETILESIDSYIKNYKELHEEQDRSGQNPPGRTAVH